MEQFTFRKRWNKPKLIPLAKDIQKFTTYLQDEIKELMPVTEKSPDKNVLFRLSKLLLCLTVCFNRKRTGETEQVKIEDAKTALMGDLNLDILEKLDEHEKHLATVLSRFETRGKRGKAVPILLTPLMLKGFQILCHPSNRLMMDILPENDYVFVSAKTADGYLRACQELKLNADQCGLENPTLIRSTKLRKHLAVMTQLVNVEGNELDVLARFMGYDIRVHRDYYRNTL